MVHISTAAARYRLKAIVQRSPSLALSWAGCLTLGAGAAHVLGRRFEAARLLLRLEKHLDGGAFAALRRTLLGRIIDSSCRPHGQLQPLAQNALLKAFAQSRQAGAIRRRFASYGAAHQVRLRLPRHDTDPERQGDLIILKRREPVTGERGVLLVKYNTAIVACAAVFDLASLVQEYVLVLEPSNWGYQDAQFLLYLGCDAAVIVECARTSDFDYIKRLNSNLMPVRIGDGEWVDPAIFSPRRAGKAIFDVVMVAAWDPLKRHEVLFRAVAQLKREGRRLRVALIGYPLSWSRARVEKLAQSHGIADQCAFYERIAHSEVAQLVADSQVAVLLSREEGSNRSVYECLLAGTPVVVYRHHRGIDLDHITPEAGLLCDDDELPAAIRYVLDHRDAFDPRPYALRRFGYENAARRLNEAIREVEQRHGRPWTCDIVPKKSAPNLRYAEPGKWREFEDEYRHLALFLRPAPERTSRGFRRASSCGL